MNHKQEVFLQFVKFGIVGISNTAISYGVYAILTYIGLQYIVANAIGFFVSVVNSFYWNNKYVFKESKEKRSILLTFIKTLLAYSVTSLFLSSILLAVFVEKLSISKYIAPLIVLCITVPLNFLIQKFWAFKG